MGPFSVIAAAAQYLWSCLAVLWAGGAALAAAARSGWRAAAAGARLAPAVQQGAQQACMLFALKLLSFATWLATCACRGCSAC